MLTHAPEALRLRTTRRGWPWPLPRIPRVPPETALYVAVCLASLGAAALVIVLLLQQDGPSLVGPLAACLAFASPQG